MIVWFWGFCFVLLFFFLSLWLPPSLFLSFNFEIFSNTALPVCHIFAWKSCMCYDENYICGLSLDDVLEVDPEAKLCDCSHPPYVMKSDAVTSGHSECLLPGHPVLFVTISVLSSSSFPPLALLFSPCFSSLPYLLVSSVLSFLS